jgi:ribosomal protein S18 acetylase RimI-like enzyme
MDDIPRIRQCNLDNLPENYPESFFQRHIYTFPELSIVATDEQNDYLVGYALGRVELLAPVKGGAWSVAEVPRYTGHITSVAVDRDYRGFGLANSLMLKLHAEMVKNFDVDEIFLHVRVTNDAAISLYKNKLRYDCLERMPDYYADREDAWVMRCTRDSILFGAGAATWAPPGRAAGDADLA